MMSPNAVSRQDERAVNTCIVIAGPTAVGKTALAINVARHFDTSIISCDSRQCFKELKIGVARPSEEELAAVHHDFIASHSILELVTAATFEQYALNCLNNIFKQHSVAVVVGGTGLYVKALCEGLDEVPTIDPAIRANIIEQYRQHGITWLQQQLQALDPLFVARGEMQNPQRMMRALEVVQSTGQSIYHFQKGTIKKRDFNIIKIGLELPRPVLVDRINQRVDTMMEEGLLEEVQNLASWQHLNALQTVGYKELFSYLDGTSTFDAAVEGIKINTRQYAKRQMTWFKKDAEMHWCGVDTAAVITTIEAAMNNDR